MLSVVLAISVIFSESPVVSWGARFAVVAQPVSQTKAHKPSDFNNLIGNRSSTGAESQMRRPDEPWLGRDV
jgi:hypothetical protein